MSADQLDAFADVAATITPVVLPAEIDGVPLEWSDWEPAPVMSHVPLDCLVCGDARPVMAMGRSPGRPGLWSAVRCRRCQETRVTTWRPGTGWRSEVVVVWPAPPQPYGGAS